MNKLKNIILLTLFILSIFLFLWVDFNLLPKIPCDFNETSKINSIIKTVCLSYVTSYIFYLIVVFSKEIYDIKNSQPYIQTKLREIQSLALGFKSKIENIDGNKFKSEIPTIEEIRQKFTLNQIDLTSDAGEKRLYPFTWEQLFKENAKETRNSIDRVLILLPYIDSKLINLLNKLYECSFFNMSTKLAPANLIIPKIKELTKNNNINFASTYADMIIEYLKIIKKLNYYIKKE